MGSSDADDDALASTASDSTLTGEGTVAPGSPAIGQGARIGRHVLGDLLGAGAMGVVYRAHDPDLDRPLAIKLVRSRGGIGRARLLREAQALAKLRDPHVVPVFDVGTAGDDVYVVMPLLEGGTLGAWMRAAPRPWRDVVDRFVAAGRGLAAAHAAGLVHRDFKPENVLLGAGGEVQVADFGLARVDRDEPPGPGPAPALALELTRTGDVIGTPAYMAPEQLRGEPSGARADQFAFFVALWEALYGARPFSPGAALGAAALGSLLSAIEAGPPSPPADRDVPPWLRAILVRGLRADPAERWPSVQAALDVIAVGRSPRRGRVAVVAAIAALLVVVGAVLAVVTRGATSTRAVVHDEAPRRYRSERLTSRSDLVTGALSPDGRWLALATADRLIVRGVEVPDEERILVRVDPGDVIHDVAWSPDGTRLAISLWGNAAADPRAGNVRLVEVATGEITGLTWSASDLAFVSDDVIAGARSISEVVQLQSIAEDRLLSECPVPPGHEFVTGLDAADGGEALVVGTVDAGGLRQLHVLGLDCRVRATLSPGDVLWTHVVPTHGRSILIRTHGRGSNDLVEVSLDGAELGRGRLPGDEAFTLIGAHQGRLYRIEHGVQTTIERWSASERSVVLSSASWVELDVAPDRATVAWIELDTKGRGPLRVSPLAQIGERGPPLLQAAAAVGWSPDGSRLAVAIESDAADELVVIDPATGARTRVPSDELELGGAPVWVDDHRVALPRGDNRGYRWADVDGGETGDLVDPSLGWAFHLRRSPRDGTLALLWNRAPGQDVYTIAPGGEVTPTGAHANEYPIWSPRGELLLCDADTGTVDRVLAGGAREPVARIGLLPQQQLVDAVALGEDELLLNLARRTGDVLVAVAE
jgi:hypothetical protein